MNNQTADYYIWSSQESDEEVKQNVQCHFKGNNPYERLQQHYNKNIKLMHLTNLKELFYRQHV